MPDTTSSITSSLSNSEAAQWNQTLMREFQAELEKNPAADLMSMFPEFYRHEHRTSQYLSYLMPQKLTSELCMVCATHSGMSRRINMATGPKVLPPTERETPEQAPDFRTRLDIAETATIVFPLSNTVAPLVAMSSKETTENPDKALAASLKQLLWDSRKLWGSPVRGIVVQCSEDIVAKVVTGNQDSTEYTSMQFLAERAPDIPAPRAHGLITLGPFSVLFMSYIPGITLAQAWPDLSHKGKLSIQQQLEDIFHRLRSLQQDTTQGIGGVCGEGAKEPRINGIGLFNGITTPREFSDLQFSARHHGSNTYVEFLRSFLKDEDPSILKPVFTHGDVRTANIIVKQDPSTGGCAITGIIDWEDSGFYPAYYESTALAHTLSLVDEDDWYLYLPKIISPSRFPIRWLVDRLWGIHLRTT